MGNKTDYQSFKFYWFKIVTVWSLRAQRQGPVHSVLLLWNAIVFYVFVPICSQQNFIEKVEKAHLHPTILTTFYRGTIDSVLSSNISLWHESRSASDKRALKRVVRSAERIIGVMLPSVEYLAKKTQPVKGEQNNQGLHTPLPQPVLSSALR